MFRFALGWAEEADDWHLRAHALSRMAMQVTVDTRLQTFAPTHRRDLMD
ncbi:MAG: hypothetical protein ACRDRY_11670 [Pseudonocardiaceae bacterium]